MKKRTFYQLTTLALILFGVVAGITINRFVTKPSAPPDSQPRESVAESGSPNSAIPRSRFDPNYADQEKQELREAGLLDRIESPVFRLIGDDGRLTEDSIQAAGLNDMQVERIQHLINRSFAEMREKVLANMTRTQMDDGTIQVCIPPIPDGQLVLDELKEGINSTVGKGEASLLIASLPSVSYFAGFGRFESTLNLVLETDRSHPMADADGKIRRITAYTRDPNDGRVIQQGSQAVTSFGESFHFPGTFTDSHASTTE